MDTAAILLLAGRTRLEIRVMASRGGPPGLRFGGPRSPAVPFASEGIVMGNLSTVELATDPS
jgi:hypothetical protein